MKVGIGHSDNPDSYAAGVEAAKMAVSQSGRSDPCDMTLLFSTARHDQQALREAVASVIGAPVPVYGGGAVGVITNDYYGYAGDQIAAACLWLDGVGCDVLIDDGLKESEEATGVRLGQRLAELGTTPDSPVMLFYDALDCSEGLRMLMATFLLEGISQGLGFFPDLTGAGLMGDHSCSPTMQWTGDGMSAYNAAALAFSGDIRIDSVIMHGCRPATQYYTVTKAMGQVILEINGKPAISFIDELLDSAIAPEEYPFFLIFGVNHGDPWGEYDEDYYASRLCLGIDKDSGGIVMFEPDMTEGTQFQLMFRSLEHDYIKPKIDKVFDELDGREPVFAVYIDCAGRCAGYGGMDIEDAVAIQKAVDDRVPVLGLYTGVEIANIGGRPRGLDWTGVFCLFSQSKDGVTDANKKATQTPVWGVADAISELNDAPIEAVARLAEQNAAKILALDSSSIAIRSELEQKRRGFSLLAELSVSLRQQSGYASVFASVAQRINAALNMQRTVVLVHDGKGQYTTAVLQGYSAAERLRFAGLRVDVPAPFLDPDMPVLVTGAEPESLYQEFRSLFGLPYFIASPIILQDEVYAILITGRVVEATPFLVRLSQSDRETVQAISALLASVVAGQRLAAAEERNRIMMDASPLACMFWDENGDLTDCNQEALALFVMPNKEEFITSFYKLAPEHQPDGQHSETAMREIIRRAFLEGSAREKWIHLTSEGTPLPVEITFIRVPRGEDYILATYIDDLREREAAQAKMDEAWEITERYTKAKSEFIASVSHEIRTPMNAIVAMARAVSESGGLNESQQNMVNNGLLSVKLLTSAVDAMLDFSKLDSDGLALDNAPFSVRKLVEDIVALFAAEAKDKGLSLDAEVDADVSETLIGDALRLQQTLLNIVANGVKFTDSGSVAIHVSQEKTARADEITLVFAVHDTGVGLSMDQVSELFQPLVSGDTSYSRRQGGLGLGLSISYSLATLMGGDITCESRLDEGSTFRLHIPLALPEAQTETDEAAVKADGIGVDTDALRDLRVLVAEDNLINQMIFEELLTSVGVQVELANNGLEALDLLKTQAFDLVLMDIIMPEMDGLTAVTQIRADGRFDDLPVLAMTANAGAEHEHESRTAGMNAHLTKPVDPDALYRALLKWSGRGA